MRTWQRRKPPNGRLTGFFKDFARSALLVFTLTVCTQTPGALSAKDARSPRSAQTSGVETVPFILDAQRILMNVTFETQEGGSRKALVWFNMGMPAPVLTKALYRELGVDRGRGLTIRIGEITLEVAPETVVDGDGGVANPDFNQRFAPHPVEAMLPAGLLRLFVVTLDYPSRTLSIARPGARKPDGVAAPFAFNTRSGLVAVDVAVDGRSYPMVIDAGSGYSWMRGGVLTQWLTAHPDWRRAQGAIGPSNYNMLDLAFEKEGTIARVPEMSIGAVTLKTVGVLGTGPVLGRFGDSLVGDLFWDNWQKSAPGPVIGWLGANALKPFKLTIDFPNRMTYWQSRTKPDAHDLDQVGITLVRRSDAYFIGGIVRKANLDTPDNATVEGAEIGDELIAVDGLSARGASMDQILSALHGARDARRRLVIEHGGSMKEIDARVTAFD